MDKSIWKQALNLIRFDPGIDKFTYDSVLKPMEVVYCEDNVLVLAAKDDYCLSLAKGEALGKIINTAIRSATNMDVKVKFVKAGDDNAIASSVNSTKKAIREENLNKTTPTGLNGDFTFANFVVGDCNKFAHATAVSVADNPGQKQRNPFFLWGNSGLGKTHLMKAIGNYISDMNVNNKIVYVQAMDFLKDYTQAVQSNNMNLFNEKYDGTDVLLMDDIQMLTDKKSTQQQFFNLFQNMIDRSKQIVITSDCPPNKLNGFMDRLTSRFQMGIQVNINQPDFPQRLSILKRKVAEFTQKEVPDDVLSYIAEIYTDNVRELEGALTRVSIYSDFMGQPITLDFAKEALDVLVKARTTHENTYESCISVVANFYNINSIDILGAGRSAKIVLPRHIVMYILKNKYNLTYQKIGAILNGKDHTTVMNGCMRIENEIKTNEELKMAVESIMKKL